MYAHEHCFPSSNILEPLFNILAAMCYFTDSYSDSNDYQALPDWILQDLPTSFDTTFDELPSLVCQTFHRCSSQSSPGFDGITYTHLRYLSSSRHLLATLFNKLLQAGISPSSWSLARIHLIHKRDSTDNPSNFRPIALTSVVGKLFHKILAARLEHYLLSNSVVDTSVQKGFVSNFQVYLSIYSQSLEEAFTSKSIY